MNIRNTYDKELEKMIEYNEYLLNPFNQIPKSSYLDYNYPNRLPVFLNRLKGFERVVAEYHENNRKKIVSLEEMECLSLMKFIFPDIYKIVSKDKSKQDYEEIDWYVPSLNLHIEHKGRKRGFFDGMTIDRPKYDSLMKEENPYFLNSTPIGIFIWNLRLLGELEWILTDKSPKSNTGRKRFEKETNYISYLPLEKSNDLTYLLLNYT